MNLIRLIVIALIIYLVIQIFKRWAANKRSTPSSSQQNNDNKMVKCETCHLHIPESDALQKNGQFFCSQEHLESKQD